MLSEERKSSARHIVQAGRASNARLLCPATHVVSFTLCWRYTAHALQALCPAIGPPMRLQQERTDIGPLLQKLVSSNHSNSTTTTASKASITDSVG